MALRWSSKSTLSSQLQAQQCQEYICAPMRGRPSGHVVAHKNPEIVPPDIPHPSSAQFCFKFRLERMADDLLCS